MMGIKLTDHALENKDVFHKLLKNPARCFPMPTVLIKFQVKVRRVRKKANALKETRLYRTVWKHRKRQSIGRVSHQIFNKSVH